MSTTIERDPRLTVAQERFRDDVRSMLAEDRVRRAVDDVAVYRPDQEAAHLDVYRWLGARGWLAPGWPVEYGGLGLGPVESAIVTEEMALAGVPDDVHVLSVDIVGSFLLLEGTEEQRRRHLPAIARGERIATVLFTEPDCGSDLSALTTRAEPDGDGWRLYGSKIFNMKSRFGDVALCAARTTDSGVGMHGITLFLLPLRSAGVHIEPVPSMANDRFDLVVIDGVRVTRADVVGRVDDGWRSINDLLQLERTGIDFHAKARRLLDLVIRRAAQTGRLDDPAYALPLAELDARLTAGRALSWQMVQNLAEARPDPVASAMAKWYVTEQFRPILHTAMEVDGLDGALSAWDADAPGLGRLEAQYRLGPVHRLASGTSEVMLYLIATNGLGLL
ncbi:acyl-CoA dehydrogenase family protein [Actinoplanes sp. NEAU-A12]|uniref:Acyl-CoA dehydrogenase family protein n=1 Tax=Actinoplanes sandaracinus TaxID=3045177 RepID=A0ABT6WTC5_9ACTN|nr:acyl-CoA dehydrogenase family protein [Actinoplanes sandaracinus]MDI6103001.1 acyl-CoA dehydrogenase family protein [Actinoplanes sandaracinus]